MPDDADLANDHAQTALEQHILDVQRAKPMPPSTKCLNCGEPIQIGRYCCKDCAEDDEARIRHRRRNGLL